MKLHSIILSSVFVFSLALFDFAPVAYAQDAEPATPCFTLERGRDCGTSGTGTTITCDDGSGGPSFIRVAPATYVCKAAIAGSDGQRGCNNTGTTVHETLTTYSCASGTYTGTTVNLSSCRSAKLDGASCKGNADVEPTDMAELLSILDTFE